MLYLDIYESYISFYTKMDHVTSLKCFDTLLDTKQTESFMKSKIYICGVWNEFLTSKAQNSHGIDGRGYSPV